jgi:biopolymer transport protein ExbD
LADRAALDALLQQAQAQEPQPELHIKAQGKAKYEAVAGVLASAQRQGLTKIGIVGTEQFAAP